jgi:hypothetical protein
MIFEAHTGFSIRRPAQQNEETRYSMERHKNARCFWFQIKSKKTQEKQGSEGKANSNPRRPSAPALASPSGRPQCTTHEPPPPISCATNSNWLVVRNRTLTLIEREDDTSS